jgi:SAM-dependent methyltransferase
MSADAAKIIDLYERHAKAWAEARAGLLLEKSWLDHFCTLLPSGGSVFDVGCGSGEPIARFLIEHGYEVTGVDSSPSLIDICARHFPCQHWTVADMRVLNLDTCFDGIIAWDSFFHLCPEDQRRMFPILRRHAASHAALLFTSGSAAGTVLGEFQGEPLYHASLDCAEYRELLDRYGFSVVSQVVEDPECGNHTVWLAQLR